MAQKPDGKSTQTERVTFTRPAAERIAKAVRRVEQGDRGAAPLRFSRADGGVGAVAFRLGKTTATWTKGTLATITLWHAGTPPNETQGGGTLENCVNKFGTVGSGKFVALMRGVKGRFYLIAAEC